MKKSQMTFANRTGTLLSARIDLPADDVPLGYVLLAHCFTCSKDLSSQRRLSRTLVNYGIGVMSFDFTGLGSSDGDFAETGFSSQGIDLVDAVRFLTETYEAPKVLIGHSLGGTAALFAARELPEIHGVATIGAPCAPDHIEKLFTGEVKQIEAEGSAEVSIGGRPFTIRKMFLDDVRNHPPESWIKDLHAQLMILHSPVDNIVGVENAERIFKATRHPKSFVSLREADHLLSQPEDAEYAGRIIGAWALSFMRSAETDPLATNQQVAARIGRDNYVVTLRAGRHYMTSDEPVSVGGRDLGGNPYDYLLSALGACTVMTLRMYADRKGIDLESATVHLSHEKVHATDCQNCDEPADSAAGRTVRIDRIERVLELEGNLTEAERARMLEIADKCPVHRTLTTPTVIHTRLA